MNQEATYSWTQTGVSQAVEDAMDCWPRLRETFVIAETPVSGSAAGGAWAVKLDPRGTCRVAHLTVGILQAGSLQQVAQALRAAVPET